MSALSLSPTSVTTPGDWRNPSGEEHFAPPPVPLDVLGRTAAQRLRDWARMPEAQRGPRPATPQLPAAPALVSPEELQTLAAPCALPLPAARHAQLFRAPVSLDDAAGLLAGLRDAANSGELALAQYVQGDRQRRRARPFDPPTFQPVCRGVHRRPGPR